LAKLRSQLARRPAATIGSVFSRSGFTDSAMALAGYFAPQTVLLWSGTELTQCIRENEICSVLLAKFRECVEEGAPKLKLLRKVKL
jgi:hypothetical protein